MSGGTRCPSQMPQQLRLGMFEGLCAAAAAVAAADAAAVHFGCLKFSLQQMQYSQTGSDICV